MITTIVFDIGGVFFHQPRDLTNGLWYSFGVKDPAAADEAMNGTSLWDSYKRGGMSEEAYWTQLMRELSLDGGAGWQSVCRLFERTVVLDTELVALVQELKKYYSIHALSNAGAELERRLDHFGIRNLFDVVINSHRVEMAKPDAAIYRRTCELVGCAPENILFVDDKIRNARAAEAVGFHTHVYTSADWLKQDMQKSGLWSWDESRLSMEY